MRNAGAVIHSHGMESCIVTMIDPLSKEFRVNFWTLLVIVEDKKLLTPLLAQPSPLVWFIRREWNLWIFKIFTFFPSFSLQSAWGWHLSKKNEGGYWVELFLWVILWRIFQTYYPVAEICGMNFLNWWCEFYVDKWRQCMKIELWHGSKYDM